MTDLRLIWDVASGAADLTVAGADLDSDDGLGTAVIISLFTDRRVADDELPAGESWRRGYWGDSLNDEPGDETGSKLWLLGRAKQTPAVLVRAEEYAQEALAWLVDDGIARAVAVVAAWIARGVLSLCVTIDMREGGTREFQFADALRLAA